MNREAIAQYAKQTIILIGAICFVTALADLPMIALSWGFLLVIAFSTIVAPRMSIELPGSRFAISFSDAAIFLAFLYYGGPAAIVVAALESLTSCLHLKSKGFQLSRLMIATNVAINSIAISVTYLAWLYIPELPFVTVVAGTTPHLVSTLGCLAILQFATSSLLAAVIRSTSDGSSFWITWKRDCFSSSLTQMVGAALAGIVYKLIYFGDLVTGLISFAALAIAYFGYRQSINKVGDAMHQAESAEREKAEVERERRREAEKHASQLTLSLEKEELANEALRKSEKDLQHAALYDSLTDLPNRKHFGDILRKL
ncbi:MAG: GGDEF domain-containing protein, partial [Pyrinomonadaceae bacterium]